MGRDTTDTTMRSDTGAMQRDTSRTRMRDTTMHDTTMMRDTSMMHDTTRMHRDTARDDTTALQRGNLTYETSTGGLYTPPRGNAGLSTEQVKQLQQALNNAGCHAGPVDGLMGPKTRQGIACLREQRNITGNNLNDVLQALNLGFTAPDTTAAPASSDTSTAGSDSSTMRSDSSDTSRVRSETYRMHSDTSSTRADTSAVKSERADSSQVGGENKGRIRPPADSDSASSQTKSAHDTSGTSH
ncbi:MAG: peptidoglycan-binding protein [Gemmatimonadaceae bacterium]|nr:peptidoglycan-binding protein [Gemmatimonadaceae bacterium]